MSHSGSSGVTYLPDRVVFKSIKRGNPIAVETVVRTIDELQVRVLQLLECLQSIEAAVEIFALDVGAEIANLVVADRGNPVLTRFVPVGLVDFVAAVVELADLPEEDARPHHPSPMTKPHRPSSSWRSAGPTSSYR